jgi:hypothetical protein
VHEVLAARDPEQRRHRQRQARVPRDGRVAGLRVGEGEEVGHGGLDAIGDRRQIVLVDPTDDLLVQRGDRLDGRSGRRRVPRSIRA